MRKLTAALLCILAAVVLIACSSEVPEATTPTTETIVTTAPTEATQETTEATEETTEATEPVLAETQLYGIDVSGMTKDEAQTAITKTLSEYKLQFTANDKTFSFTAKDLSMVLNQEAFDKWFEETSQGNEVSVDGIISYDLNKASNTIYSQFAVTPKNATVVYNPSTRKFEPQEHTDGTSADITAAKSALKTAVSTLAPSASASVPTEEKLATITIEDPRVAQAAEKANSYLTLNLTYIYEAEGIETSQETVTVDALASMITPNKDLEIEISETGVDKYVNDMSYKNGGRKSGDFITSHGTTISMQVDYFTATLDQAGLAEDLTYCLQNKISGTRNAPFLSGATSQKPYGGSYVEIDLDNQYLWVYKGGSVVTQTPLVSGNVSTGAWTPPGVFSIYYKATCTYLVGTGYRSYVDYWMPFNGGIGLHDANWRTEFGGTIYMYDGSHGCVNLPPANAGAVYNNVSAGTKVIVYGGERTTGKLTQEFTGSQSYTVTTDDMPFQLDVKVKYTGVALSYRSSDRNVVTVDDQGNVTIIGGGTATITVTSEGKGSLEKGTYEITIYVEGDPVETEPTEPETEPTVPDTEPTEPETEPTEPETEPTEPETEPETQPTEPETEPETQPETTPETTE